MSTQDLLNELEDILMLELNTLQPSDLLEGFADWDSMAHLSLIALFDSKLQKKLTPAQIRELKHVSDILKLAGVE
ncbi:hypothetical protein LS71_005320 [Helicobacter jaachi]|uniref:Acyl carrier protein n=1 Tax=Helicobacter jaachi TaxID=1677920 RepID=A0A4U8T9L3_9HELI|nr:hypothetical protein [Helicobacter jaachi]TLD96491.1 hypothetical protein LS71_005320 [Helicobacter jaachi]